jgi:transketolase
MRTLPDMLIAAPGDPMETRACMRYLVENPGPSYLRLGKAGEPCMHKKVPTVQPGLWIQVSPGDNNNTLLTTGATLSYAIERQKRAEGNRPMVHSMPLWSMACKSKQSQQVISFESVTTIEDHLTDGGFGSWLLEALAQSSGPLDRVHIEALDYRVCGTVGSQTTLNKYGGLI